MARLQNFRVTDKVLTNLIHGYANGESVAPFLAPPVTVQQRAGKIIKFTKENFVLIDTKRAPGDHLKRVSTSYSNDNYSLNQNAVTGKVPVEEYEEAESTDAQIDLKEAAAFRAAEAVMLSWENDVISQVTNPALYEANCQQVLAGTDQWDDPASDPEVIITDACEAVRSQIGLYPNSMVMGSKVYKALRNHPIFRDRLKYTSAGSVNLDMIGGWFDLSRGVKVASKVYKDPTTGLLTDFMDNQVVLFYSPEGGYGEGFVPAHGSNRAVPSYAYTYTRAGYPRVTPYRWDDDTQSFLTDVILEHSFELTGLGDNDLVGSGFLLQDVVNI